MARLRPKALSFPVAVVWPEFQPHNAVFAYSELGVVIAEFKLALRSMWPNPLNSKRISTFRFNYLPLGKSAFDMAFCAEHGVYP